MGVVAKQVRLLLWRDLLRRKRKPLTTFLEVGWPLFIFFIVILVRQGSLPADHETCLFRPWVMPSSGGIEFVQSFLCNLDNNCRDPDVNYTSDGHIDNERQRHVRSSLVGLMADATGSIVQFLPRSTSFIDNVNIVLSQPQIQTILANQLHIQDIFLDTDSVSNMISDYTSRLSTDALENLLSSRINLHNIPELFDSYVDVNQIICTPEKLAYFVRVDESVGIEALSSALCKLSHDLIPELTVFLQSQLNFREIVDTIYDFLGDTPYGGLSQVQDSAAVVEILLQLSNVVDFDLESPELGSLVNWVNNASSVISALDQSLQQIPPIVEIFSEPDPEMSQFLEDSGIRDVASDGIDAIVELGQIVQLLSDSPTTVQLVAFHELYESVDDIAVNLFTTFGLSGDQVNSLLAMRVNITQMAVMESLLLNATTASRHYHHRCTDPGLASLFLPMSPSETEIVRAVQDSSCQMNLTLDGQPISHQEDLQNILSNSLSVSNLTASAVNYEPVAAFPTSGNVVLSDFVPFLQELSNELSDARDGDGESYGGEWSIVNILESLHNMAESFPTNNNMQRMTEVLDLILTRGSFQNPVYTVLQDVLLDAESTADFLTGTLQVAPDVTDALLEALIDVNVLAEVIGTQLTLQDVVCDAALLGRFFLFSVDLDVDLATLSSELCGSIDNISAEVIAKSINLGAIIQTQVVDRIPAFLLNDTWWEARVSILDTVADGVASGVHAANMVNDLIHGEYDSAVQQLTSALSNTFRNIEELQGFGDLLGTIGGLLDDSPVSQILDDVSLVSNAVLSLTEAEPTLLFQGSLGDFVHDPEQVLSYFSDNLELPADIAQALLDAQLSFSRILTYEDVGILGLTCSLHFLDDLLVSGTNSSMSDLMSEICDLNTPDLVELVLSVAEQLNIGEFLKYYMDLSPSYLLGLSNMTSNDLGQVLELLTPIHSELDNILGSLGSIPQAEEGSEVIDTVPWDITSVSGVLCGQNAFRDLTSGSGLLQLLENEFDYEHTWNEEHYAEMDEFDNEFCVDLYKHMQTSSFSGPIIWQSVKPLFRGQILYTPVNNVTNGMISVLREFVDGIHEIHQVSGNWLDAVRSVNDLNQVVPDVDIGELLLTMRQSVVSDAIQQLIGQSGQELADEWETTSDGGNLTTMVALNDMITIIELMQNITSCFDVHITGYVDEDAMVMAGEQLQENNTLLAGLVFLNTEPEANDRRRRSSEDDPVAHNDKHIKYKLRMDSTLIRRSDRLRMFVWSPGPESNFFEQLRYMRGFLPIQDLVEHGIIRHLLGNDTDYPRVGLHQMPYPCWQTDDFHLYGSFILAVLLTFTWLCIFAISITYYVSERENNIVENMQVMGLRPKARWLAWFINTMAAMTTMSVVVTLCVVYGRLMIYSDGLVIFTILILYSLAVTMFAYMVSVFFRRTTVAVLVGVLGYLLSATPYIIVYNAEYVVYVAPWKKVIMSLSLASAFTQTSMEMMYSEQQSHGIHWDNLNSPITSDFLPLWSTLMMVVDALLYGIIGWFFSNVFSGPQGAGQPVYFLFTRAYWGYRKKKRTVHFTDFERRGNCDSDSVPGEPEPEGLPIGITLRGLTKSYRRKNKPAVDGLNVNFFQGQVTAFLGHNGAGKTSTINMLTGNIRPSNGLAFINGRDVKTDIATIREDMGVCPQYDILFGHMTVEEHLEFYAALKGKYTKSQIKEEVTKMLSQIGLENIRKAMAAHLSGGQRRRLSIGVAFIGGSKVVLLDEPTSGVDPAARRNIWDVIVKHRESRTILLSTHHLDEAEVIGDRIVIIHRGRLLCSGSPMFLKNYFGSGYHLTIAKNVSLKDDDSITKEKNQCRAGEVLAFIRQYIPKARLVEEIGTEITFVLPHGNRRAEAFRDLFKHLDQKQEELRIHRYGISDTPLEEIFLKVTTVAEKGEILDPQKIREWAYKAGRRRSSVSLPDSLADTCDPGSEEGESVVGSLRGYKQDGTSTPSEMTNSQRSSPPRSRGSLPASDLGVPSTSSAVPSSGSGSSVHESSSQGDSASVTASVGDSSAYADSNYDLLSGDQNSDSGATSTKKSSISETPPGSIEDPRIFTGAEGGRLKGSRRLEGKRVAGRQFRAMMTKRLLHNLRNKRNYLSQVLLPTLFIIAAMVGSIIRPRPTLMQPNAMTPALYSPGATHIVRFDTQSEIATRLVSTLPEVGLSTTCMPSTDTKYRDFCIRNFSSLTFDPVSEQEADLIRNNPGCSCIEGHHTCPAGAEGWPTPYYTTRTQDRLHDITHESENVEEYILRTHNSYVRSDVENFEVEDVDALDQFSSSRLRRGRNGGWSFDVYNGSDTATVWFNNKAWHAIPAYYNSFSNMVLRANAPPEERQKYGITVINAPFRIHTSQVTINYLFQGISDTGVVLILMAALCFLPPSYITYLVRERSGKEKRLQHICGVSSTLYWCTAFLWDLISYVLTSILIIAIVVAFQLPMYNARQNLIAFIMLVMLFGWAAIPLMYLMARWFKDANMSYMVLFLLNLFIGLNSTAITFFFSLPIFQDTPTIQIMKDILSNIFLVTPQYCLGDGLLRLARNQFVADVFVIFKMDVYQSPFASKMLFWHMITMVVEGAIFFAIVLLVESRIICGKKGIKIKRPPYYKEDSDVSLERQRVVTGEAENDALVLYNMSKVFRRGLQKVKAVDHLCVGVPKGECFGLLGVNGAGKTTSFKMITGDTSPTSGAALLNGNIISEDGSNMDQEVGYCPQNDALDPMLTGMETLKFYARLKGIPEDEIAAVCTAAILKFSLGDHKNKLTGAYSAGNKRKLQAAVSLLGEPQLVLMDEPTTGMDPGTRRLVWNNILSVVKDNRSVVLTSHSMAECDALCTRMAIMVNGAFMCLGNSQHLKNKFGSGYTATVRASGDPPDIAGIIEFMGSTFPGTVVKDRHLRQLEFGVPPRACQLSELFGALEDQKRLGTIEDYSVTQTTMDQVFLHFARHQGDSCHDIGEGEDAGDTVSVISGSTLSSLLSVLSRKKELRSRRMAHNLVLPSEEGSDKMATGTFNLENWAYNIPPEFLKEIKKGPNSGPESKQHIQNVLNHKLPTEAKNLPPARLAQYLGPDICKTVREKTRRYRQYKKKHTLSSHRSRYRNQGSTHSNDNSGSTTQLSNEASSTQLSNTGSTSQLSNTGSTGNVSNAGSSGRLSNAASSSSAPSLADSVSPLVT